MRRFVLLVSSVVLFTAVAGSVAAAPAAETVPTFTKDVAPIIYANCVICHRPGQVAPMSLTSYDETRPWARAIREKVASREMPPWYADPSDSLKIRNDRRLTQAQIDTIVAWVDGGAPKGDTPAPLVPKFAEGWSHPKGLDPDVVQEMPVTYTVAPEGELAYQNFYVRVPFTEQAWISAVEMRPGNRAVVHHSIVNVMELPPEAALDANAQLVAARGNAQSAAPQRRFWKLIGQAAGKGFEMFHDGSAKRISPGMHFQFNMHYQPNGRPETDRSSVGLWLARGKVTHEVITDTVAGNHFVNGRQLNVGNSFMLPNIPPHAANFEVKSVMPIKDDITLYSLSPHMHLRGKDMKYTVRYPDGREQTILNVPKYDFNWQLHYELVEPVRIPAGSTLMTVAHYDNSIRNRYNPAPEKEVFWAEQSWDEMFQPFIEYSVDSKDVTKEPTTNNE